MYGLSLDRRAIIPIRGVPFASGGDISPLAIALAVGAALTLSVASATPMAAGPGRMQSNAGGLGQPDDSMIHLPLLLKGYRCVGDLSGNIVDAITADPLPNVLVSVDGAGLSDVTDDNGDYLIPGVPPGQRSVTAALDGYVSISQDADVGCGMSELLNFALSPHLLPGEMRIVMTWGEFPRDLDSHLWLPPATPCHIYWFNPGLSCPFLSASLDRDDNSSYGPETITIEEWYPGTYTYAVYNWSKDAELTTSEAWVHVYMGASLVATYGVPTSGSGHWWHVFDIDGTTQTLTTHNTLTPDSPGPYDPGPGGGAGRRASH